MKLKIISLLAIALMGSFLQTPNNVSASPRSPRDVLTAPASYDYSFTNLANNTYGYKYFDGTEYGHMTFNRTADGSYYNYTTITPLANPINAVNNGFGVTMTFTHSNTIWLDPAVTGYSGYVAGYANPYYFIGSDNTVGTIQKSLFSFSNQTNHDYQLLLDYSSTSISPVIIPITTTINGGSTYSTVFSCDTYGSVYISAFQDIDLKITTGSANYFNAYYIIDLGVNSAWANASADGYSDGLIDGYNNGLNGARGYILKYTMYNITSTAIELIVPNAYLLYPYNINYVFITGDLYDIYADSNNSDRRVLLNGIAGTDYLSTFRSIEGSPYQSGKILRFPQTAVRDDLASWTISVTFQSGYSVGLDESTFDWEHNERGQGVCVCNEGGMSTTYAAETGRFAGVTYSYESNPATDEFLSDLDVWIVPAIIVVIVAGGAFTILKWKKERDA